MLVTTLFQTVITRGNVYILCTQLWATPLLLNTISKKTVHQGRCYLAISAVMKINLHGLASAAVWQITLFAADGCMRIKTVACRTTVNAVGCKRMQFAICWQANQQSVMLLQIQARSNIKDTRFTSIRVIFQQHEQAFVQFQHIQQIFLFKVCIFTKLKKKKNTHKLLRL